MNSRWYISASNQQKNRAWASSGAIIKVEKKRATVETLAFTLAMILICVISKFSVCGPIIYLRKRMEESWH